MVRGRGGTEAISDFGGSKSIGIDLQKNMHPIRHFLRLICWFIFIVYMLFVTLKTLTGGIVAYLDGTWATQRFDRYQMLYKSMFVSETYNLSPFKTIYHYIMFHQQYNFDIWFYNIFGNILLFIPLGLLIPVLFRTCSKMGKAIAVVSAIAVLIELIQFVTKSGVADVDAVILRSVGAGMGLIAFHASTMLIKNWGRKAHLARR